MTTSRIVICMLLFVCVTACERKEQKVRRMVWEQFDSMVLPDLKDSIAVYMMEAFTSKKAEQIADVSLARQLWQLVDSSYTHEDTAEVAQKWKFWEQVMQAPDSHMARTQQGDVFLEYDISSIGGGSFYYSVMAKVLCQKGDWYGFFRIFLLWTPEKKWRVVDYEFDWPTFWRE